MSWKQKKLWCNKEKYDYKKEDLVAYVTTVVRKYTGLRTIKKNKQRKTEKAVDDKDDLILCSLTSDNWKKEMKKKGCLAENVEKPTEAGMLCMINSILSQTCWSTLWVPHVISPTMKQAFTTSPRWTSWYREVWAMFLLPKRERFA